MSEKTYRRVLIIAGSDSGGGAGIQADIKTCSALGAYSATVITALTAQNTCGVSDIMPVPPAFIESQFRAVMDDIGADAVKIGMLHSPEVIQKVASLLREYEVSRIVLDPVMVAKGGDPLITDDAVAALCDELLPMAAVVTPNRMEAERLTGQPIETQADLQAAASAIPIHNRAWLVIKGGGLSGATAGDYLYNRSEARGEWLEAPRAATQNLHGTGCTFSSAIAAGLAHNRSPRDAVLQAKQYITRAIHAGSEYKTGSGHGPVHHFFERAGAPNSIYK